MEQLKDYIYMDHVGIDSLLAQISSEVVEENRIQTTKRKTGAVAGNLGFSELVKKIFKADASMSGELETVQVIDRVTIQPYEAKVKQIIKYVEEHEMLLRDRSEIINKYQEDKQNFVFLSMPFDTDFYNSDWSKTVSLAEQFGYIPFYKGGSSANKSKDTYQYHDSYYKTMVYDNTKITMNLSINKMQPFGGFTSHLAVLFRATQGNNIHLGVFGHVYRIIDSVYQIKPYAVWRA